MVLTLRTDNPRAELALFDDHKKLAHLNWLAGRELAETIHSQIKNLLEQQGKDWADIKGLVAYSGPGSFTGLRIGLTVANTLAYGLDVPIVATSGTDWQMSGVALLTDGQNQTIALPDYGAEPHITRPRK